MIHKPRMSDPRWVKVCKLWDLLTDGQQQIVMLAMQAMTEQTQKGESNNESEAKDPSSGQV